MFAHKLLVVQPTHFYLNEETAVDNKFQKAGDADSSSLAKKEHEKFVTELESAGIEVLKYKQ